MDNTIVVYTYSGAVLFTEACDQAPAVGEGIQIDSSSYKVSFVHRFIKAAPNSSVVKDAIQFIQAKRQSNRQVTEAEIYGDTGIFAPPGRAIVVLLQGI
jgi:hypothetical protein